MVVITYVLAFIVGSLLALLGLLLYRFIVFRRVVMDVLRFALMQQDFVKIRGYAIDRLSEGLGLKDAE